MGHTRVARAYQFQEDAEKGAERLGHGPLTRARGFCAIQEKLMAGGAATAVEVAEVLKYVMGATPYGLR